MLNLLAFLIYCLCFFLRHDGGLPRSPDEVSHSALVRLVGVLGLAVLTLDLLAVVVSAKDVANLARSTFCNDKKKQTFEVPPPSRPDTLSPF